MAAPNREIGTYPFEGIPLRTSSTRRPPPRRRTEENFPPTSEFPFAAPVLASPFEVLAGATPVVSAQTTTTATTAMLCPTSLTPSPPGSSAAPPTSTTKLLRPLLSFTVVGLGIGLVRGFDGSCQEFGPWDYIEGLDDLSNIGIIRGFTRLFVWVNLQRKVPALLSVDSLMDRLIATDVHIIKANLEKTTEDVEDVEAKIAEENTDGFIKPTDNVNGGTAEGDADGIIKRSDTNRVETRRIPVRFRLVKRSPQKLDL